MAYRLLVSSYTDAIYTISFDSEAGTVEVVSTTRVGHHPSWVTPHPDDPSLVFAGLEQAEGVVLAIKFDDKGEGNVAGRVSSGGADPCSLLATKDELLVANVRRVALRTNLASTDSWQSTPLGVYHLYPYLTNNHTSSPNHLRSYHSLGRDPSQTDRKPPMPTKYICIQRQMSFLFPI